MEPKWKIFYSDGSTFSSEDGSPKEAPFDGFICVVGYTPKGDRYICHGKNHYFFDEETQLWFGYDWHGVLDYVRHRHGFKEGRMLDGDRFREIMNNAHRDPEFPVRRD